MCKKTKEQKFIMLPSVDFCFQELMEDEEVRRGFIGAFLRIPPEEILDMELLPKKLRKKYIGGEVRNPGCASSSKRGRAAKH
ncbi:MAG: hypothetical protein ACLUJR_02950 [Mediterraneibacter gnavus]